MIQSRHLGRIHRLFFSASELRAGWRLAIFVALFLGPVKAGTLVLHGVLSGAEKPTLFLLGGVLDFLCVLLASWAMARLEGRTIADYGLPWRGAFGTRFWQGALLGFGCITFLLALMRLAGVFQYGAIVLHGVDIAKWAVSYALVFSLVALLEEFGTRGYALFALSSGVGFWPAASLSAFLFAWLHRGNAGENWLGLINVGLFGLLMCVLLRRTGSLWVPIGFHMAFDWGETFFYGVANSGQSYPGHLMATSSSGPGWLSGGSAGPEGSLVYSALLLGGWCLCVRLLPQVRYPNLSPRRRSFVGTPGGLSPAGDGSSPISSPPRSVLTPR